MGAEKLGQRPQGPGLRKGSSERPPCVSRPWGVGEGGQVPQEVPFTEGLGWMASGGPSSPR